MRSVFVFLFLIILVSGLTPGNGPNQVAAKLIAQSLGRAVGNTIAKDGQPVHPDPNRGFNCGQSVYYCPQKPYSPAPAKTFYNHEGSDQSVHKDY